MTVGQLIRELKKYPKDAVVALADWQEGYGSFSAAAADAPIVYDEKLEYSTGRDRVVGPCVVLGNT